MAAVQKVIASGGNINCSKNYKWSRRLRADWRDLDAVQICKNVSELTDENIRIVTWRANERC